MQRPAALRLPEACRPPLTAFPRLRGGRALLARPSGARPSSNRRLPARVACQQGEGSPKQEHSSLMWPHVAYEVKRTLAAAVGEDQEKLQRLNSWLSEAKLKHTGETDEEHDQTETVAEMAADVLELDKMNVDVGAWLGSGPAQEDRDLLGQDSRMAAALVQRLFQAYHEHTGGQEFDDEDDSCFHRLHGIAAGTLGTDVSEELLRRLVKSYVLLPTGGA